MTRVVATEVLSVLGGALLVVALLLQFDGPETPLRSDQQWGNLMAFKHLHPDGLPGDMFYGPPYYRGYNPAFFSLQAQVVRRLGGDLEAALRVLAWPIGVLFLVGHYALFRHLTGSWPAAGLGALSALVVRNSLGGEYWGFSGLRDVLPRSIASGLTPLLILAFLWLRGRPFFAGYFLLVGLAANLHPVSGLHLAQISAVAHLWLSRFQLRAWGDVLLGVPLFALGALPFILRYVPAQQDLSDRALLPIVREALHYRYPYLLFPLDPSALMSVAFHVALPAVLLLWMVRRGKTLPDLRVVLAMGVTAVVVGVGGIALIQGMGVVSDRPYVDIHQLRATRFMYPALLAAFPLAFATLLHVRRPRTWLLLAMLFILSLIPPASVIHAFSEDRRDTVKHALGIEVSVPHPVSVIPVDGQESTAAERRLWRFAAEHVEPDALVFTDSFAFRYETLRPITGSFKDGGIVIAGTGPLYHWYIYVREIEDCRRRRGDGCWFALADKYQGRYAVVDPDLDRAVPADDQWTRIWAEAGWSLWRRGRSGSS